jgi:hypothetical protein
VAGRADHEVTRAKLNLAAVVHHDFHAPRDEVANVGSLAAVGLGNGLDVLGPLPARLKPGATDGAVLRLNQLKLALAGFELACLLRRVETLADQSCSYGLGNIAEALRAYEDLRGCQRPLRPMGVF